IKLAEVDLSFFGEESAARRTVQELDAALAAGIVGHVEGFRTIVGALSDAVATETVPMLSLLAYDAISDRLSALVDRLDSDNVKLQQGDPQALIDALLLEWQLLKDRQWLADQYAAIEQAVEDLKW